MHKYWEQFRDEHHDMFGVEDCDDDVDSSDYMDDQEDDDENEPISMESLGLSWNDFM
ncbi:MAG: hypothetical protein PVI43_01220 [Candidatus Bathyarchaeota archaeon]|jgi:hypothetical protein